MGNTFRLSTPRPQIVSVMMHHKPAEGAITKSFYQKLELSSTVLPIKVDFKNPKEHCLRIKKLKIFVGEDESLCTENSVLSAMYIILLANKIVSFKNLESLSIEFSMMRIDTEEKLAYLFSCIAKLKSLKRLKVGFYCCSGISNIAIASLGRYIAHIKSLERISVAFLSRSPFGINQTSRISNEGIKKFAKYLRRLKTITHLTFGFETSGRIDTNEGIQYLLNCVTVLKYLKTLSLKLRGVNISDQTVSRFGAKLGEFKHLEAVGFDLRKTILMSNENLLIALVNIPKRLALGKNNGDDTIVCVNNRQQLKAVSIGFTMNTESELSQFQMIKFGQSLQSLIGIQDLEILVYGSLFVRNSTAPIPEKVLTTIGTAIESLYTLKRLVIEIYLPFCVTFEGTAMLIESICKLKSLKELKLMFPLSKDVISVFIEGISFEIKQISIIQRLAKFLPNLTNLESLSLNLDLVWYEYRLSNQEMLALCMSLSQLENLKQLELVSGADISNDGIHHICKWLPQMLKLEKLTLIFKMRVCKISDQEILMLGKSLSILRRLRSFTLNLDLSATEVTQDGVNKLQKMLNHLEYVAIYRKDLNLLHHP